MHACVWTSQACMEADICAVYCRIEKQACIKGTQWHRATVAYERTQRRISTV